MGTEGEGKPETGLAGKFSRKQIAIALLVLMLLGGSGALAARMVNKSDPESNNQVNRQTDQKTTAEGNQSNSSVQDQTSGQPSSQNDASSSQSDQSQQAAPVYDSLSMITPYVNESDVSSINEAFGLDAATAAWGFVHNGVDFMTATDLVEFRAAADGIVSYSKFHNDKNGMWQVNMAIDHNPWSIQYAWEFSSTSESDADRQISEIAIASGQTVKQGDSLGKLYNPKLEGHIHLGVSNDLINTENAICPEPYFTDEAKDSVYRIIQEDHPAWQMCY